MFQDITIQPNQTIARKRFDQLHIIINNESFLGAPYVEGQTGTTFSKCEFNEVVIENIEEVDFQNIHLNFVDCNIRNIEIKSITTKNLHLALLSCLVNGILDSENIQTIYINNCIAKGLFIKNIPNIHISYSESNLYADRWNQILLNTGLSCRSLLRTKQRYYIHNPKKLKFETSELEKELPRIYSDEVDRTKSKISLSIKEKMSLDIGLNLHMNSLIDSTVDIKNSLLTYLSIEKPSKGKIDISHTKIDYLYLNNFSIDGTLNFYSLSPFTKVPGKHKIEIHECNLKGVIFSKVALNKYDPISFYKTRFEGCQFVGCDFSKKPSDFNKMMSLKNIHYKNDQEKNYYKDQYEIFIQIKSILEKNGNFHEVLKLNAVASESLRKTDDIGSWDKLILIVNSLSNYHNLSVKRALIGFFISSIILYILYLSSLGRIFTNESFDWKLVGYYFTYIDLTHKFDFLVNKKDFTIGSMAFDFLGKLCIGFYIYQFIAAFRKYGRSK